MAETNVKYKDRLFRFIFGREEHKDKILSLYNAVNGTSYTDKDAITIYTIEDIIYIDMKNDVALIFDSHMTLWEHQSSLNPNMPLRGLMYFGKLYDKYITEKRINIYGSRLQKIPTPSYIVFYNGEDDAPPVTKLRLSDAFEVPDKEKGFEWTAIMYNLNPGKNDDLLEACEPLRDYMVFVNKVRELKALGTETEQAIDSAVMYCIDNKIMEDILLAHRAEVKDMCLTEFNEKVFIDGIKEEGRAEGKAEGRDERDREKITGMLQKGKKPQEIADFCDYPLDLILDVAKSLKENITVTVVEETENGKDKT